MIAIIVGSGILLSGIIYGANKILHNNKIMIFWSLSTIKEIYNTIRNNGISICFNWTNKIITNTIGKHLIEMHHKYYIIHYPFGIKWYKIIIPRKRGPCLIDEIIDSNGNNVNADIFDYLGPCHNFHGQNMTPEILGYESLTFNYINGTSKTFKNDECIII